ncbi:MAG: MutS-related protein [Candidatus Promineifilaceae bacterium]
MTELSLLWAEGKPTATWPLPEQTIRDLELGEVAAALCPEGTYREIVTTILYQLCLEPDTIRCRQAVVSDLEAQPQLAEALRELLPLLDELALFSHRQLGDRTRLHEVMARAGELELLVEAVHKLRQVFATIEAPLQSTALVDLQNRVESIASSSDFRQLVHNLPPLLSQLRTSASITIGVNLDHLLRPEEALLLAVNDYRFSESTLLDQLLGKGMGKDKGIAPLHTPPLMSRSSRMITGGLPTHGPPKRVDPLLVPLFKDLSDILEKVTQPIAHELKKYVQLNSQFLVDLRPDFVYYVHALALIEKVKRAGMSWCWPEIAPMADRVCRVQNAYNVLLAINGLSQDTDRPLQQRIVTNNIELGEEGRIAILTGPNRGGKTTYMQSVGLVQVLAQLGLPVPGTSAEISPVDAIYTHYPLEERLDLGTGRFGDEAQRIRAIFERVTGDSLVLFNESLATTNMGESVFLAQNIVRSLREIGARVIFTTHLHDLAAAVERINTDTAGDSIVISLVASPQVGDLEDESGYSYRIQARPPLGRSYAENIAARHGISRDQLRTLLKERNLLH